jgi:hypothetical protein
MRMHRQSPLPRRTLTTAALLLAAGLAACDDARTPTVPPAPSATALRPVDRAAASAEAERLLTTLAMDAGATPGDAGNASAGPRFSVSAAPRFTRDQNVFLRSTLAIDFERRTVTLPLFTGVGPSGAPTYYVVTEAADFDVARLLGVNFAPKMVYARDTDGAQEVTFERGRLRFRGDVDFRPVRRVVAGPDGFPPSVAEPGSVGDAEYSSIVVLPSGSVLNAQIVANRTGTHDRLVSLDVRRGTVTLQILDGFQGGDQSFWHLVTDASDAVPAAIEKGTYAPRMANVPTFGESSPFDPSALLGFSPVANGETGLDNPERQGLNSTVVDGGVDPINIFPIDPVNTKQFGNNYSPLWDAHINMWTPEAIASGQRRRITGFADLRRLVEAGLVTDFAGNAGAPNDFVAGLRPSNALINCPVIAQPGSTNDGYRDFGFGF